MKKNNTAKNTRFLRKAYHMTQAQLAKEVHVDRQTIVRLEKLGSVDLDIIEGIADFFKISLEDVIYHDLAEEMDEIQVLSPDDVLEMEKW